jgi:YVTN family beta-propeller protein
LNKLQAKQKPTKLAVKKGWCIYCLSFSLLLTSCADSATPQNTSAPNPTNPTITTITTTTSTNTASLDTVLDIPLPDGASRLDYQSLDPQTGLLFIAHLGASSVIVFDSHQNKVVANITGIASVHGVLAVPELGLVYASATGAKQVLVIDEKTFKVLNTIPAGDYPDGLAYDPVDHSLYVSDEGGTSETVIDTQTNKLLTSIQLEGEAGNTQYDPLLNHILVDVQTLNQLVIIDPKTNKILTRYPLADCQNDHSLLIDVPQRLAFITCDGNARLLVLDLQTMQIIYKDSVGASPDVLALDKTRALLYVAGESGIVSVFAESKPQAIHKLWEGFVAKAAHTIAVNNQNQQLFLPLEDVNGKPVLRIMQYH